MSKHRKTWDAIFADPVRGNISWSDVEALLVAVGGNLQNRSGSTIAVELNGVTAVFDRPHPQKEAKKGMVKRVRQFLSDAGGSRP